LAGSRRIFCDA
jgi:hypothetical protein